MRNPRLRHVHRLRLSILGVGDTTAWREADVDEEVTLADLRVAIRAMFDGPECRHHVFAEEPGASWSPARRRWGDRWTMIDFRDPTVIDETTARVGTVLRDAPLLLSHTCDGEWTVLIDRGASDLVPATEPEVRVVAAEGAAPFACSRGSFELEVLHGILADPAHPAHADLAARLEWTYGPWSSYSADHVDVAALQRQVDRALVPARHAGPLDRIVGSLPHRARTGARTHIEATGLHLPPAITEEDAESLTGDLRWLLLRIGMDGVPARAGDVDPGAVAELSHDRNCTPARVAALFAVARRMRLVYNRLGRLRAKKDVLARIESPTGMWSVVAAALPGRYDTAADLLLLAVADGSIGDARTGLLPASRALALADAGDRRERARYGLGDVGAYGEPDPCDTRCDCPVIAGSTWHDVVAQAIQDAAAAAAVDGARTVASLVGPDARHAAAVPAEWVWHTSAPDDDPYGWPATPRHAGWGAGVRTVGLEAELLQRTVELREVLTALGLERRDDGGWLVPDLLRELARTALGTRGAHRYGGSSF